ncbi:UvrD-helicase domain-containing protein [Butyrivibrio sp. VCD2006]|uniref:UvrD-helicase domain-containing protein n=1 Tax=Butyrivibrio sp. VCD2006 TaxID=1280664 RepID=UPI0004293A67|nr:UvrD-helicase domain-containing protein [Butyrivibrio sp. VCD2006]
MEQSNIYFATNTFNYGDFYSGETRNRFDESKGNVAFFRQVMDYDALKKLRNHPKMRGSLNSNYYMAHISQVRVLDPNFASVMISDRKIDPVIEAENKKNDAEYGYPEDNDYYPLLEEIVVDNKELSYADQMLGKWLKSGQGLDEKQSEENPFGLFLKQRVETDLSDKTVTPEEAGFEEIDDTDPYYYMYEEAAGKKKKSSEDIDKARLYEEKYGSIFRAFEEVSQEEIIHAPVDQYSFVNAGPGTGKTYTLMKKMTYMMDELGVDPEGILVLCFTNAAVNEIKARIKKYAEEEGDRSFINVDVRTFHSFSWLLISQANELFHDRPNYSYIDISKLNYDQSIRKATEIIRKFGDEVFGGCDHLIVDEIQDLTDERGYLVITMVDECIKNGVGITVLGDSCQAIYDYSDDDTVYELKSDRFYKYMFSKFFDVGTFYRLDKNHRQTQDLIKRTQPLREAILDTRVEGKKAAVKRAIEGLKKSVSTLTTGSLSMKYSQYEFNMLTEEGTACLMCRNNAQVLATSSNLRKKGIKHVVNAYNEFEYLSDWIGKIFGLFTKEIITYDEFKDLSEKYKLKIDVDEVWIRLQDLIGSQNNVQKISEILKAVAKSKVDDPVFRNVPKEKLIVSNIHKSKGREYDTVVVETKFLNRLINESASIKSVQQYVQEAKTMYVAVTRPRTNLFFNSLAGTNVSLKKIKSTGRKRWVRGDGSNLKTIEVRAMSDADVDSYNTPDIQEYIIKNVKEGDEIKLVLDRYSSSAMYNVVHVSVRGERVIGRVTDDFVEDVDAIITPYGSPWPRRITDLFVSGVHTQISQDYKQAWCWVDFCGLGSGHTDIY